MLGTSITLALVFNPHIEAQELFFKVSLVQAQEAPKPTVHDLIAQYANEYGVSSWLMEKVISCETGGTYDPSIQSFIIDSTGPNGHEDSWGLAQIHLPDHPDVTRVEAQDENFALKFMASNIAAGNAWMWTCYRNLRWG